MNWPPLKLDFRRITSSSHTYIPEIDGLRFLAIMSVLVFHIWFSAQAATPEPFHTNGSDFWNSLLRRGANGVELFFIISGFILALPFANQYISDGKRVNLKRFYTRRVTRLEPPYVIALVGIYLLAIVLKTSDTNDDIFSYHFFFDSFIYTAW